MRQTLKSPAHSELVIKKSRFIACVQPVEGRAQAQQVVLELWRQHPEARHVCWALMAGGESAAVDDGEPSGTAGRPMLEVLRHQHLEGVLATVVRYFGGVKLGAGGLVRAYTDAVAQALLVAEKVELQAVCALAFAVRYPQEGVVRHLLQQHGVTQWEVAHDEQVTVHASVVEAVAPALRQALVDATQGTVRWLD
ncbi:YigZ family protein [Corticibacter populi]|uniref:YigZ family protein n=1 Tax=Corticibacter populi TaxID=1550736 RepID=A0A3M6R065_9BURK|nr:YigZ family protein [Corticibacter populi]RMX08644.1 YigZ family protein [Corticibacter populi]